MTTYNTGNPLGSSAAKDLYDNAQNLDFALNSLTQAIWLDRFGVGRRSWFGLEVMVAEAAASYGIITLSGVTFTTGATVKLNEALLNDANDTYYKWTGAFPTGGKIVPADSTPDSAGGIGPGKWLSVGDTVLRGEISDPEGATKYPELQIARWRDTGDIRGWGAIEGGDATSALNEAIKSRAANHWGTSSNVIIDGHYRIEGKVLLTTDVRLIGNWATITSTSSDWIFESAYKDSNGNIVTNHGLDDAVAIGQAPLRGVVIKGIMFSGVSKVFHLNCFTERCGMEDLTFKDCGIAWDARLSFYPFFKNILIRGVKSGFEDVSAYQLRHQCNQVRFEKITIAERKYGELIDDDIIPTTAGAVPNCQNISHTECTYEGVTKGVQVKIITYGYQNTGWYAEQLADNLFEFTTVDHFDVFIGKPLWVYGVENQGHFNNLKGRCEIWQAVQYDYNPIQGSKIQFNNSVARVVSYNDLGKYRTIDSLASRIFFDSASIIIFDGETFSADGVPINTSQTNLAKLPVNISGYIPRIPRKAIGATGAAYTQSSNTLNISTDIKWSDNNLILVAITYYQSSLPSNTHNSTALLMNGFKNQMAGNPTNYERDGDNTLIRIEDPAEGGDSGWLASGDFTLEGIIRIL
ncbi:hypothetical protein M977_03813 [Buttiauxella gaviniae ATCC 51604]|uniref:Tail spike TSP1/Gp66 N-terminal domain-containing protein n=1 Tax=Buttiauxella gaviniae ATCC 51604 TaxID=1354253 RepID=A0A1B7HQU9_9ENTR|nr:hypothetical protein [Buttiauxella gaviniae]OAT18025.1 hypothetical protein M977_03813 [Buttiauxella gaviniae ATCC 51604]